MIQRTKSGFTLVELMIYMAIVGMLLAVIIPNFLGYLERSRRSSTESNLRALESAILLYQVDTGTYPQRLSDLIKKPNVEQVAKKWNGPYLKQKEIPTDGWSNRFEYKQTPQAEHKYSLLSYGPNGKGSPKSEWIDVWDL